MSTYHDGIPSLSTGIAAEDSDTLGLDEQRILTATDAIGEPDLVRRERVDLD